MAIVDDMNNEHEVVEWNRMTIADGQWLNDKAIKPLKERTELLAEAIGEKVNIDTFKEDVINGGYELDSGGELIPITLENLNISEAIEELNKLILYIINK